MRNFFLKHRSCFMSAFFFLFHLVASVLFVFSINDDLILRFYYFTGDDFLIAFYFLTSVGLTVFISFLIASVIFHKLGFKKEIIHD